MTGEGLKVRTNWPNAKEYLQRVVDSVDHWLRDKGVEMIFWHQFEKKGWLISQPTIPDDYLHELAEALEECKGQANYEIVLKGLTPI